MKTVTVIRGVALLAGAALAGAALIPRPAAAATGYVALGDSYSAGVGTRNKVNDCYQSPEGYPALVARDRGWTLSYQACSGAVIDDVVTRQAPYVTSATGYVTVSAGGNDAGFVPTLTECAQPGWMSDCGAKMDQAQATITGTVPGRLDRLYSTLRSRAPGATRVAVGYPRIFNGEDCNALTFFSPAEETRLNALADLLNGVTRTRAQGHNMRFVDPTAAFTGHAVCDNPEWVNGLSNPIGESYHPNDAGNVAYSGLVQRTLGYQTQATVLAVTTARSAPTADAVDPPAEAYQQVAPRLAAPENLERARAAGLDPDEITRLDTDLRSGDKGRARAAMARLKHLDRQHRASHGEP